MKKILVFILVAILGVGLGIAISPKAPQVSETEQDCIMGKNYVEHCVDVYEQPSNVVSAKDPLDKDKYPSYMLDEDGYFVPFEDIGIKLKEKYFGSTETHMYDDYYFLDLSNPNITKFKFVLEGSYNADDLYAKTILMLQEFRNYGFYYISNGVTIVEVYWIENGVTHEIRLGISVATLLNEDFFITPDSFIEGEFGNLLETESCQINQVFSNADYDNYVTDETFIGYVLDFK